MKKEDEADYDLEAINEEADEWFRSRVTQNFLERLNETRHAHVMNLVQKAGSSDQSYHEHGRFEAGAIYAIEAIIQQVMAQKAEGEE